MGMYLILALVACQLCAPSSGLTADEVAQFQVTGITEMNTGLVGNVSITEDGNNYRLTSNGIPDHTTGTFPAANVNPNSIREQSFSQTFPKNPQVAQEKSCLPNGPIAFATNGIPLFNPYTIEGNNAVEGDFAETFDECNGHPDQMGVYHYHQDPVCLNSTVPGKLLGVALDGFPIYGPYNDSGHAISTDDLDECNGRTVNGNYRYHVTFEFPYVMGCYMGTRSGRTPPGPCYFALNGASTISALKSILPLVLSLKFLIRISGIRHAF